MTYTFKQRLGALAYDVPRFLWTMRPSPGAWVRMRNRAECIKSSEDGIGVECKWQWTSDLHVTNVFPGLGRRLMNRALSEWPIELRSERRDRRTPVSLSFIIGHRGLDRLPHLLLTLKSIALQRAASVECIVVEQASEQQIKEHLPKWVRYLHTPAAADAPYNRAWAFNIGAREARGEVLVLQDGDALMPERYAQELLTRVREGYEVINLKRFIFFLTQAHTSRLFRQEASLGDRAPQSIMQNALGVSVAITREAYFEIGGFDESFVGWGGEDNEFWQRARSRRVWPFGYLPFVHLWHPSQPEKLNRERATTSLFEARSLIPVQDRIRELSAREFGRLAAS